MMRKSQKAGLDAHRNSELRDQVDSELHYHLADGAIAFVNLKKWVSSEWRSRILEAGTQA